MKNSKNRVINKKFMIGIFVFCVIIIPILVNGIMIATNSVMDANSWVGFWGSYFGSIFGGLITLFVLYSTITVEKNKYKNDNLRKEILVIENTFYEYLSSIYSFCDEICQNMHTKEDSKYNAVIKEQHNYILISKKIALTICVHSDNEFDELFYYINKIDDKVNAISKEWDENHKNGNMKEIDFDIDNDRQKNSNINGLIDDIYKKDIKNMEIIMDKICKNEKKVWSNITIF